MTEINPTMNSQNEVVYGVSGENDGTVNQTFNFWGEQNGKAQLSRRKVPYLLPYLPNRQQQEQVLDKAIKEYLKGDVCKPLVCIIHGEECQSLDNFLARLIEIFFPENLGIFSSIKDYDLPWPSELKNPSDLDSIFCKKLGKKFLNKDSASVKELNQFICSYPATIIIRTYLSTENWHKQGFGIINNLLNFWGKWPELTPNKNFIIFLVIKYKNINSDFNFKFNLRCLTRLLTSKYWKYYFRQKRRKYINRKINNRLESLSFDDHARLSGIVLPMLTEICEGYAEEWARSDVVKNFVGDEMSRELVSEIRSIFKDWEITTLKDTMPMGELAKRLRELLENIEVQNR